MKISYKWLQKYFKEELPEPKIVANLLTMHAFEVEGVEEKEGDSILDIKILANRAHDCLSYFGIAREVGALLEKELVKPEIKTIESTFNSGDFLNFKITDSTVRRGMKRLVLGVKVGESPEWLKNYLKSMGQKSINNIVDITNFVMWETGQPVHIFDWDKLAGGEKKEVNIRNASAGEKITTLDNKDFVLTDKMSVIADSEKALDIAGIKGGALSGVDENTRNILLSACNFNPTKTRLTSQKLNLKTDASYRFEHDLHPEITAFAMDYLSSLVFEVAQVEKIGSVVDVYSNPLVEKKVEVSISFVEKVLGEKISLEKFESILTRLHLHFEKIENDLYKIQPSFGRLDIENKDDLAEEIGRIYGYENIRCNLPVENNIVFKSEARKEFYYFSKIREFFVSRGFSEVFTTNFVKEGEVELQNPTAEDKKCLRRNIYPKIKESLDFNTYYADFLGLDKIKIFEIGKVFITGGEYNTLVWGVKNIKKQKGYLGEVAENNDLIKDLENNFSGLSTNLSKEENIVEVDLDDLLNKLSELDYGNYSRYFPKKENEYRKISVYPFMLRDIAIFVREEELETNLTDVIKDEAGDLLVNIRLFDTFIKTFPDGTKKKSFAFRLVFQSYQKTLSDEEINVIMDSVTRRINSNNLWQVRE